jgi:hypothetical protein
VTVETQDTSNNRLAVAVPRITDQSIEAERRRIDLLQELLVRCRRGAEDPEAQVFLAEFGCDLEEVARG